MSEGSGQQGPAGWKKDPTGRYFGRYWDGEKWTDHVVNAEKVASIDHLSPSPEPSIFPDGPPASGSAAPEPPARPAVTLAGASPHSSGMGTAGTQGETVRRRADPTYDT